MCMCVGRKHSCENAFVIEMDLVLETPFENFFLKTWEPSLVSFMGHKA